MILTLRQALNAERVFVKLATNENIPVHVSLTLLPVLEALMAEKERYEEFKKNISEIPDVTSEQLQEELTKYLEKEVEMPDVTIDAYELRGACKLFMPEVRHIQWWLTNGE